MKEATHFDKTIEFVDMASKIVDTFADKRPISSLDDHRLALNEQVLSYIQNWVQDAESHQELRKADREKRLLSCKL